MKEIEDNKLKVVNNPFALLDGLKNGKVTKSSSGSCGSIKSAIFKNERRID